jgi:hypothetical protein
MPSRATTVGIGPPAHVRILTALLVLVGGATETMAQELWVRARMTTISENRHLAEEAKLIFVTRDCKEWFKAQDIIGRVEWNDESNKLTGDNWIFFRSGTEVRFCQVVNIFVEHEGNDHVE